MLNHTVLQGRLVADPELKDANGISVCRFCVAWSEKYRERESKLFLECTAWRSTAEFIARYFSKGQEIVVEGKLHTDSWQATDGSKRHAVRLTVDQAHFCGPKQNNSSEPKDPIADPEEFSEIDEDESRLPF